MDWGFFCLERLLVLGVVLGSGETESAPDGNRLAIFCSGSFKGSGETDSAPDRDRPATLVSRGSSTSCLGRNRPNISFQGAPFEARRMGSRNGRAVVP